MKKIVIMQPYYFAWYGFFEQIKLADIYVFYDDVQYVKRSLMSRVDIKTLQGTKWLTVPLEKAHQGDLINEIKCHEESNWREEHIRKLTTAYEKAPYFNEMICLVEEVFNDSGSGLADVTITAIRRIARYFELLKEDRFFLSSELSIEGRNTNRLYNIAKHFNAETYITGMGALRYMDFDVFENGGIDVEFMDYAKTTYPQINGEFNPHVSVLDLIANTGKKGLQFMNSKSLRYDTFIKTPAAKEYLENIDLVIKGNILGLDQVH